MFDQFGNYREIEWTAAPAAVGYRGNDKFPINPDLENFKLVRSVDLRKQPKVNEKRRFKLMLIGSSKTNIFIDGPDPLIDEMVKRLEYYKGKSWPEIQDMRLERDSSCCKNFMMSLCDPLIIDYWEWKEVKPGESTPEPKINYTKAKEICAKCNNFEYEPE
jgi:hypothetical protein